MQCAIHWQVIGDGLWFVVYSLSFCLMWLVGTCDELWVWTNYCCKWAKVFFFGNWVQHPYVSFCNWKNCFVLFFWFIVMLQVPKAWWSMYFKSFDISMVHWLPNFRHFDVFETPNAWSKINQDNQITHIAICFSH
jgi:hypothetical protein